MMMKNTKDTFANAALNLFVEQGIDGTGIRDIANGANMGEGTLYRHYKSKSALAQELYQTHAAQIEQDLAVIKSETYDIEAFLSRMVIYLCDLYQEKPEAFSYIYLLSPSTMVKYNLTTSYPMQTLVSALEESFTLRQETRSAPLVASQLLGCITNVARDTKMGILDNTLNAYIDELMMGVIRIAKENTF